MPDEPVFPSDDGVETTPEARLERAFVALQGGDLAFLSPIGPLIIAAAGEGVTLDSRGFARIFELAHALVLRECNHLAEDLQLLEITTRNPRTGRITYQLTDKALVALGALPPASADMG